MKDIIKNILKGDEFNCIDENKGTDIETKNKYSFIYSENKCKSIYYVVTFYNNISDFNKRFNLDQDYSFEYICSKEGANEIKKNTSMIILIEVDDIREKDNIQSEILDLEEDMYFFKKYVLIYTKDEIKDLKDKIMNTSIKKYMEDNIHRDDLFEEYKISNVLSAYSLILKLYIKFPHKRYSDTFAYDNIQNLNEKIEEQISIKQLTETYEDMLQIKEENIKDWLEEKINLYMEIDYE